MFVKNNKDPINLNRHNQVKLHRPLKIDNAPHVKLLRPLKIGNAPKQLNVFVNTLYTDFLLCKYLTI